MRTLLQVVSDSSVFIEAENYEQKIHKGYNILVGFSHDDTQVIVDKMVRKITNLRIFPDENDKLNLSIKDIDGEILSISQFTLYADLKKGNRPSFSKNMAVSEATKLYNYFNESLIVQGLKVKTGMFQAHMDVKITNTGPITIMIDSDNL
jgi:D-aminoacyl-tRNA deacylase